MRWRGIMNVVSTTDKLLTDRDLARHLQVSLATVRKWRLERRGPRWIKIGRCVRYRPEDIRAFIERCPHLGEMR